MSETNGVIALDGRPRGRVAPAYPSTTLPSGYTVTCRRMAAGLAANLNAQAYRELEATRPQPPTQRVEIAPDEWRDEPIPDDPAYQTELAAWTDSVRREGAIKLLRVIQSYALLTPTDDDAVAAYREAMAAVGMETPADDREIFVWSIVAPDQASQQALVAFVLGISEAQQEAIAAAKRTFRGDVPGAAPGALPGSAGA